MAEVEGLPGPTPAAGNAYYQQQRAKRFLVSPVAESNWRRFEKWRDSGKSYVDSELLPVKAHISPNSQCNFHCSACAVSDFPRGKRAEPMSLNRFNEILDQLPTVCEVFPTGLSEVLMTPQEDLLAMLGSARGREFWVQLVTNASLLHQRDWIPKIADLDLNEVCISIDGATKGVFELVRRGSNFERVIENTANLARYFTTRGIENRLKVQMTVQRDNAHEMEKVIQIAHTLGITSIQISIDIFDWGSVAWRSIISQKTAELNVENLAFLVDYGTSLGIRVGFVTIMKKFSSTGPVSARCKWPFSAVMISSDNRIVPCCHISNPDFFEIEAEGASNMAEIWQSKAYQAFRASHLKGEIPDVCRPCYRETEHLTEVSVDIGRRLNITDVTRK